MGQTEEVFEALNVLCAAWQTTVLLTVQITTVQDCNNKRSHQALQQNHSIGDQAAFENPRDDTA
uniref:Uncharacterized protein n=1 Tax=Moniliophthora roreri TaxID=221103 RepID=A0A0W0GCZ7_MONRR